MHFDCLVIGNGLMGSAAAKYLAAETNNVGLIGASHPVEPQPHSVYASHQDAGRILRLVGKTPTWTRWELDTADALAAMQSHIPWSFYNPEGCLYVQPNGRDAYLHHHYEVAGELNIEAYYYSGKEVRQQFPYFNLPSTSEAVFEHGPAGIIKPLKLIEAQNYMFEKNGGTRIEDVVVRIESSQNKTIVICASGKSYSASQLLICTGSFTNFHDLLASKIELRLKSETTILAEVSEETASEFTDMPPLLYEIQSAEYAGIYMIRPLQYPDGKYYLKMGCDLATDRTFKTLPALQAWFQQNDQQGSNKLLRSILEDLVPSLPILSTHIKPCVVCYTPSSMPYIESISDLVSICVGGNGYAAMCSDALGKQGAQLILAA